MGIIQKIISFGFSYRDNDFIPTVIVIYFQKYKVQTIWYNEHFDVFVRQKSFPFEKKISVQHLRTYEISSNFQNFHFKGAFTNDVIILWEEDV